MKFAGGVRRIASTSHRDSDFRLNVLRPCQITSSNATTRSHLIFQRKRICSVE